MEKERQQEKGKLDVRHQVGLMLGPLLFLVMLALPMPEGLSAAGWRTAAVGVLMAVWWITEAIPIPATALLPLVLFPVLGVGSIEEAAAPYANPLIFLFMGGFMIALGMQRWDLHRRIALNVIGRIGTRPRSVIAGFMISAAFLSMWVSNTATAVMMLPIALSVVELARKSDAEEDEGNRRFGIALLLSIAYACNIGGMGTLIGTPPNALLAGFMNEAYGIEVGFAQWMTVGIPLVAVGLPLTYWALTHVLFPQTLEELPGGRRLIRQELASLGSLSRGEAMVGVVFGGTAALWIFRPLIEDVVPGLSDAGIAIFGALLLFGLPVNLRKRTFVLDWASARRLPWDVLILFGGGLTLAGAIERTGLAAWIGQALEAVGVWPPLLVIFAFTAVVILLTEMTSNTATAAAFLPIVASIAVGIGQSPFLLAVPVALAASCAFMLPVATPPNAIVYGSGRLSIPQMARAGVLLNVLFAVLITALAYTLLLWVFGVRLGQVPPWALG